MLKTLLDLIRNNEVLRLIQEDGTVWHSLRVRYETPHVDRLWTQLPDGNRLNLHRISSCDKALLHPHPWPSAVFILDGLYEMVVGHGFDNRDAAATLRLTQGSSYEMVNPKGWHSVRPLMGPSYSLMLTGKPWDSGEGHPGKGIKHEEMSERDIIVLKGTIESLLSDLTGQHDRYVGLV